MVNSFTASSFKNDKKNLKGTGITINSHERGIFKK